MEGRMTRNQKRKKRATITKIQKARTIFNKLHPDEVEARREVERLDKKIRDKKRKKVMANKRKRETKRKKKHAKIPGDKLAAKIWGKKVIIKMSPRNLKMVRKKKENKNE